MAKSSRSTSGTQAVIHDQKLLRGNGGELHQTAQGDTPVLSTAHGVPSLG